MIPELLVLALEYRRAPLRFRGLIEPGRPLPTCFDSLVSAVGGAMAPAQVGATAAALGTDEAELRESLLFFLRQVMLGSQADPYRVLGLTPQASAQTIAEHYHALIGLFHPDRAPPEERPRQAADSARLNAAYRALRDPEERARHDSRLARPRRWGGRRRGVVARPLAPEESVPVRHRVGLWVPAVAIVGGAAAIGVLVPWAHHGHHHQGHPGGAARGAVPMAQLAPLNAPPPAIPGAAGARLAADPAIRPGAAGLAGGRPAAGLPLLGRPPGPYPGPYPGSKSGGQQTPEQAMERFLGLVAAGELHAILGMLADDARIGGLDGRGAPDDIDRFFQSLARGGLRPWGASLEPSGTRGYLVKARLGAPPAGESGDQAPSDAGEIRLELVAERGAYRIASLAFRITPNQQE